MKRLFELCLGIVIVHTLAACGDKAGPAPSGDGTSDTSAQTFKNKIALSIDKTKYDKEERIEVTMDFSEWIRTMRSS